MAKKKQATKEPETTTTEATEAIEATPATAEPTPKKRARKPKAIESEPTEDKTPPTEAVLSEPIAAGEAPEAPPKKGKKKRASAVGDATLADAFAGYLRSLEDAGKSEGTIFSYRLELTLAGAELGIDTKIADLTPERVLLFFKSERVMRTRSGRAKSPLSIDKTRRVMRQALVWAETAGLVARAPVPELAASH